MADQIATLANKVSYQQERRTANKLRKALLSGQTIVVTLKTGSIFTLVEFGYGTTRFKGMVNGKAGTFHVGNVKLIQTLAQTKEGNNG